MKDHAGEIIYVGKAVNLRSRVRSYFTRTGDTRAFVGLLDHVLGDLETVVVGNEKEALLLENELIKQHKPRFNVKLRDDKNFICLRLDVRQDYPAPRGGAADRRRTAPTTSAPTPAPPPSARRCGSSTATSSCAPARDHVLHEPAAALPAVPDRPLPGRPASTTCPATTTTSSVREAALFLEGKATELLDGPARRA